MIPSRGRQRDLPLGPAIGWNGRTTPRTNSTAGSAEADARSFYLRVRRFDSGSAVQMIALSFSGQDACLWSRIRRFESCQGSQVTRPRSSVDQSGALLSRRSPVRVRPGLPRYAGLR